MQIPGKSSAWQWDFGVEGTAADNGGYCRAGVHVREPRQPHGDPGQVEDEFGCCDTARKVVTTHPVPEAGLLGRRRV
ncbi:MAG: hypothetical protein U5L09_07220 [Bacteroidales bacterium]|nr:hypothetical protein [Bacteroidales bacterium]